MLSVGIQIRDTHISNTLVKWSYEKYLCKQISIYVSYLHKVRMSQYVVICSFLFAHIRNLIRTRLCGKNVMFLPQ